MYRIYLERERETKRERGRRQKEKEREREKERATGQRTVRAGVGFVPEGVPLLIPLQKKKKRERTTETRNTGR